MPAGFPCIRFLFFIGSDAPGHTVFRIFPTRPCNGVVPLPKADPVGNAGIKTSGGTVSIDGPADLRPDLLLGNVLNIDLGPVNASHHGQLAFRDPLDLRDIILGDDSLPDIHADLHHIGYDGLADAVRVVHIDHAACMDGIRYFFLQGFDQRSPHSGRQEQVLLGTPVVMIEDNVRMHFSATRRMYFFLYSAIARSRPAISSGYSM